jgi:hypothetical protein
LSLPGAPSLGFAGLAERRSDVTAALAQLAAPAVSQPQPWTARPGQAPAKSDGAWVRAAVILSIIGVIIVAVIANSNATPTSPGTTFSAAPSATPAADASAVPAAANTAPPQDTLTETRPDPQDSTLLDANQIAYCLAEDARMSGAQRAADLRIHSDVATFNTAVQDYNSRCGHYRYAPADLERAKAYVEARRANLEADGVRRMSGAAETPAPSVPVETEDPTPAASPPQP